MGDLEKPPATVRRPTSTTRSDVTRLHTAVIGNRPKKIIKYVNRGVNVDTYNSDCQPPIFCAALLGKSKVVKTLLELGADPNARCYPEGSTPVHGACYVGCTKSLKLLLHAGGDLRLTDSKRRTPQDWAMLQLNEMKRRNIKDVLDGARVCAFKSGSSGKEMLSELNARIGYGNRKNFSSISAESFGARMLRASLCCPGAVDGTKSLVTAADVKLSNSIVPIGYGKVYFGSDHTYAERCGAVIGLPFLNEISDLKLEEDPTSASWICGKFSTFVPMIWVARKTSVSVRELRKSTVDDAIPDILIAELNSLAKLHHPNILMCLAVCHVDNYDSISIVFEKVSLGSLYFLLYNQLKRLSSRLVIEIISQICEALDFIHYSGYLHGFVNSHSIFLMEGGRAKLGCLEYITPSGATSQTIQVSCHPHLRSDTHLAINRHWAAPEIVTGKRPQSRASDIYSICCVMWELIYGEVPWKDSTLDSLRVMLSENPYARLPLDKGVVPHLWHGILNMGLEPEAPMRDIDLTELRDIMKLSHSRIDVGPSGDGCMKHSASRSSLKSVGDPVVSSQDAVDADQLFELSLLGPNTAV